MLVFQRDRAPLDPAIPTQMMDRLTHRGPDGCDVSCIESVSLGHQHFWTTPEEVGERQPLVDKQRQCYLVFDGRLDNRQELLQALDRDDTAGRNLSDAELILVAYRQWAEAGIARLLGPFALALYDVAHRRVICARDGVGDRSLFYFLSSKLLIVASEEQAVLAHPAVSRRLDETRVAVYFSLQEPGDGATFFADVHELLPAHMMVIEEDRMRTWRYWDVEPGRRVQYRDDAEYAAHFRELLEDSVSCRLRTLSPPAVMMSGGLDSTSVAALIAGQQTSRVRTISYVFDELRQGDERWFMQAMIDQYHLDAVQIRGDDAWPLREAESWPLNPNTPEDTPYRRLMERVYQTARDAGVRTILTGFFSDHTYAGAHYWFRDLLADRHFALAGRESAWYIQRQGLQAFFKDCLLRACVNRKLIRCVRPLQPPHWLTDRAKALLPESERWPPSARSGRRPLQHERVLGLRAARGASFDIFHASHSRVELRHPYRDRRLIEFILAVPAHQLYRQGLYKPILRNAMQGILPERIRRRRHPTSLTGLFLRGMAER